MGIGGSFRRFGKRTGSGGWEAETGSGMIFSPKFTEGDYDHRRAERGQTVWGGGGRRGRPDAPEQPLEMDDIEARLAGFQRGAAAEGQQPSHREWTLSSFVDRVLKLFGK